MRTFRLILVGAILTALFAVSAFAQAADSKIAVINTLAFAGDKTGKGGITKYVNAQNRLDNEFKVDNQQLTNIANQINALKKEIQGLQESANKNVPVNQKTITDKAQKHDDLVRELKFKQESAKAKFESRSQEVLGPVSNDIGKALQNFAKQKGYAMILDAAKLERAGLILAYIDDAKFDVTKEFIAYYNTLPGGTASTN